MHRQENWVRYNSLFNMAKHPRTYQKLTRTLAYRGLTIAGQTPVFPGGVRGAEIDDYLRRPPEYTQYAILDDDSDMLDHQLRHFFQTDPDYGRTPVIAYRTIYHLNNPPPSG